jgi:hypothetical protein
MSLKEDRAYWKWERTHADANRVIAAEMYPNMCGPRLKAVLEAEAAERGHKLDLAPSRRGATSPLGGRLGEGWGDGRPVVAAKYRRE